MKEKTLSVFNYTLAKDKIKESKSKQYPNKHFGTAAYLTCLFYKNITRCFLPVEMSENEQ